MTELSEEERASILAAPEFLEFVEQSSKIVQRALNDGYDYIRDYTINAESGGCVSFRHCIYNRNIDRREGTTLKASALNVCVNSGMNDMARIGQ
jgi:hypothetical protein